MRLLVLTIMLMTTACQNKCGCSGPQNKQVAAYATQISNELMAVREQMITADPSLATETDQQIIVDKLRSIFFYGVAYGDNIPSSGMHPEQYIVDLFNPQFSAKCLNISYGYRLALTSFGIKSRYVGFFFDTTKDIESHATTEALVNGQWQASDPTFNLVWLDSSGNRLSYEQVYAQAPQDHRSSSLGATIPAPRALENMIPEYPKLFNHMVVYSGAGEELKTSYYSKDNWNGQVVVGDRKQVMSIEQDLWQQAINESFNVFNK